MSSPLSPSDLETLRQRLLSRRHELEADIKTQLHATGLDRQGAASDASAYDEPRDRGDESVADEQTSMAAAQAARGSTELAAVNAALIRIEDGTYGICLETGEAIERDRLFANPAAARSLAGQNAWERRAAQHISSL